MKKVLDNSMRVVLFFGVLLVLAGVVFAATNCWDTTHSASESACEAGIDCNWRSDAWGGWCEQKGCWNFYTEGECGNANNPLDTASFINKSCNWHNSSSGWCANVDCWTFDGTSSTACVNNGLGIQCTWSSECTGPWEKNCYNQTSQPSCEAIIGCEWGMCKKQDCWSQNTSTDCAAATGFNGYQCIWNSQYSYCYETGCWDNANKTSCDLDGNCTWSGSSCYKRTCSDWSQTNESYCQWENPINISCTYDNNTNWCSEKGCWNYNAQDTCGNAPNCVWETYSGGWCEETMCWSFDTEGLCTNVTDTLDCAWDSPWCYENATAKTCTTITNERDCMDTYYCYWNPTNSICNEPSGTVTTTFIEWNPGCYIFDTDQYTCENSTACWWNATDLSCDDNVTMTLGENIITFDGNLNCSYITNQSICDNIPTLSTCCTWQAGTCVPDRFDQSCREQMEEPPEGSYYCEDYVAYTDESKCNKIAGYPWYMPCKWDNSTEKCKFKDDNVFSAGEDKNIMKIDNEKNCIAAGGTWQVEKYCEGANTLSTGRCELKFDDLRTCDKDCFACNYKPDKTNWSSAAEAKLKCIESKVGYCKFTEDLTAPNTYGWCKPKEEIQSGMASGGCDADCSACNYMGDPTASKTENKPSYHCKNSNAKCQWIADPAFPTDESKGRCASKSEKTCEDTCDKCYTETNCKTYGAKKGNTSSDLAAQCEWTAGMCNFISGADQMEICWDGTDNNGDGKMDCADSKCWSDPFCGGNFMFNTFGKDCFNYEVNETCVDGGCVWISENWGSWCDMPGSNCWKQDSTNNTYCEGGWDFSGSNNDTCEWHDGFGGICEENWTNTQTNTQTCSGLGVNDCTGNNCIWTLDSWCQNYGGWCEYNGTTTWVDCWQRDQTNQSQGYCEEDPNCNWHVDSWCQSGSGGTCNHISMSCYQHDYSSTCENETYSNFCSWHSDPYDPDGGWCEQKMTGGGSGSCYTHSDNNTCIAAGCNWKSGFCDPKGFGGEMTAGMGGIGTAGATAGGGFGTSCFVYDGDQTACENQTSCGWFSEQIPFCDINRTTNCPQYSYDPVICEGQPNCIFHNDTYIVTNGYCDEKPLECYWNSTLVSSETHCNNNPFCNYTNGACQPVCFSETSQSGCNSVSECRWMNGWCNPAMTAQFFSGMEFGVPVPLGFDPVDEGVDYGADIIDYGMKDMGNAYGFGIRVFDMNDSAACNGIKIGALSGEGTNTTKYYWYLDTDGNSTDNCNSSDNNQTGFEFYFTYEASYDKTAGSVNEVLQRYRCSNNSWAAAEIATTNSRQKMCGVVGGAMIAMDKSEMEKYSDMYNKSVDLRVYVSTADNFTNATEPVDNVEDIGYVTHGAFDFDFGAFDIFNLGGSALSKAGMSGSMGDGGFKKYSEVDCWTESGCYDWSCKGHTFCVQNSYGVESGSYSDTKIPKVVMMYKEAYPDSASIFFFTDKPANRTFTFYLNDSTCTTVNATITSNASELKHRVEVYNGTESLGCDLQNDTTYYFKTKVCDNNNKCGESACSSFITDSLSCRDFCNFVTLIQAPTGWGAYYDLDQDGTYEHHQGYQCSSDAGMKTDYNTGRRADVKLMTSDNSSYIEFINVTLTKTGLRMKTRKIQDEGDLLANTTTDSSGNTIGYAGMLEKTRDKIVNNLFPELCYMQIPKGASGCAELWNCNTTLGDCVNRTSEATLSETTATACIWRIPCEFSVWGGGQPGTYSAPGTTTTAGGGAAAQGGYGAVDISEGIVRTMSIKDALVISLGELGGGSGGGNVPHQIVLDKMTSDSVTLLIYSNPIEVTLKVGESKKVDVDGDGILDILIKLNSIDVPHQKADIYFEDIAPQKEVAPAEEEKPEEEEVTEEKPTGPTGEVPAVPEEISKGKTWLWVLAGILVILLAAYAVLKKKGYDLISFKE